MREGFLPVSMLLQIFTKNVGQTKDNGREPKNMASSDFVSLIVLCVSMCVCAPNDRGPK